MLMPKTASERSSHASPCAPLPDQDGVFPTEDVRQMFQTLHNPTMHKAFAEISVPITPQNMLGECECGVYVTG